MKNIVLFVLAIFGPFHPDPISKSGTLVSNNSLMGYEKDTITFSLRWNFTGDCGTDCYKFIGTNVIQTINDKKITTNCSYLFVKCPSKLDLQKGVSYTFTAKSFSPNNCSTTLDTCRENQYYLLEEEIG
jgi:hypothetical protein